MRRTSRGAGCRAGGWRQNAPQSRVWHFGTWSPQSEEPKTREKHAGCALQMPVRARGRKSPGTGPHAAELAFYLRGCGEGQGPASEVRQWRRRPRDVVGTSATGAVFRIRESWFHIEYLIRHSQQAQKKWRRSQKTKWRASLSPTTSENHQHASYQAFWVKRILGTL